MLPHEELLDIVDELDTVIGVQTREQAYKNPAGNFRAINAFIKNKKGELWIPRRTAHKTLFPSCLDTSVGGHVQSGEPYDLAFRRELLEELNIDLNSVTYRVLGKLFPKTHGVSAHMQVYEIDLDVAPNYNRDDFTEYYWLTPQAVLEKLKTDAGKGDLPIIIKSVYLNA